MSRFCSFAQDSTELSLDLSLLLSCVKHILGRFSHVFSGFSAPEFHCSPLDLPSSLVELPAFGLGCSPLDSRSTIAKFVLPCISSVFWMEGSTVSAIAADIAFCIWEFKLDLISFNLLDIWLEISSLINLVVSTVTSLFSLLLVLSKNLKCSPTKFGFWCSLLDPESKISSLSLCYALSSSLS